MKKLSFAIFILLALSHRVDAQWTQVWSDEFAGPAIDNANWVYDIGSGGWGNNESQYYTSRPENACIKNGNLLIIARQESYSGSNYTSARLKTKGLHSWKYGKIEGRIKLPKGQGIWPAFWALGANIDAVPWPRCGEIDIMEHINNLSSINGTMHWDNDGHAYYGGDTPCDVTQYHVYSTEWDDHSIKWFLDGVQYWEGNITGGINSTEEFQLPFFLLLNVAVGGNWPGYPDATTTFPDTMFVDYVRVFQNIPNHRTEEPDLQNTIRVYPNPAQDYLSIQTTLADEGGKVTVANSLGKILIQENPTSLNTELHIKELPAGIYFLLIENEEDFAVQKFIKRAPGN